MTTEDVLGGLDARNAMDDRECERVSFEKHVIVSDLFRIERKGHDASGFPFTFAGLSRKNERAMRKPSCQRRESPASVKALALPGPSVTIEEGR
jgi:hypothetical protein